MPRTIPRRLRVLLFLLAGSLWLLVMALAWTVYLRFNPLAPQQLQAWLSGQKPHFTPHPVIGWVPTPDIDQDGTDPDGLTIPHFQTDALGLRSPPPAPAPTGRRVVLVGDSMVWGVGVDQGAHMAARLKAQLAPGDEVLVAATPGWATDQELLFVQQYILPLKPTHIVWCITAVNDIVVNGLNHSNVGVAWSKPRFELVSGGQLELIPAAARPAGPPPGESVEQTASMLNLFQRTPTPRWNDLLILTGALLKEGRKSFAQAGAAVQVLVFQPGLITERSQTVADFARFLHYDPAQFSDEAADQQLTRLAALSGGPMYYFPIQRTWQFKTDGHLNPQGHQALASFLSGMLTGAQPPRWTAPAPRVGEP